MFRRPGVRYVRLSVRNRKGQRSSTTKRIAVSAATSPVTTPSPATDLRLELVDGGPSYYGQFQNGLPTDPSYFPIGVWGAYDFTVEHVAQDKDVGLNLYVWNASVSAQEQQNIANAGMRTLQDADRQDNVGAHTAGWLLGDEFDLTGGTCPGSLDAQKAKLPNDGRARYVNYGKGVAFDIPNPWVGSDARGSCWVNSVDLVSADAYLMTDPNEIGTGRGYGIPAGYGHTVDNIRRLDAMDGRRKPIWNFVEVGHPNGDQDSRARNITGPEIRAAVWHSIIAGARGILYFQHSFGGPCDTHHALRLHWNGPTDECYAPIIAAVKALNGQITSLAPALNAQTVTSGTTTSSGVRALYKWHNGHFYVIAGNRDEASKTGTMGLSCVGNATAVKLGENGGTIPVVGGTFSDSFTDKNAIHIYRIDGGSTCGLPGRSGQAAPGGGGGTNEQRGTGGRTAKVGRLPKRVSLRSGRLFVPVTCAAACTVRSRLTTRGALRRVRLAATRRRFGAGRHRVVLRLSKRGGRYVARKRKPLPMRLSTVIVEPGGGARRTQNLVLR